MGNPTNVVDLSQDAATFASTWSLYVSQKSDKPGNTTTESQIATHVSRHWANWVDDFLLRVHQAFQGDVSIAGLETTGDVKVAGALGVGGAAPGSGSSTADDFGIGDSTDHVGLTFFTHSTGFTRIMSRSGGADKGQLTYAHSSQAWFFVVDSTVQVFIEDGIVRPDLDDDVKLGDATHRFSDLHAMTGSIYGNLDLAAANAVATVGTGTGTSSVTIDADGASTQTLLSFQHAGAAKWDFRTTASGTLLVRNTGSGGANSLSIGTNDAVTMAGELTVSGDSVQIAHDNPILTIGNGVTGSALELTKGEAVNSADLRWKSNATTRWLARLNSSEDWALMRYNSSGVLLDTPLTFGAVTGNAIFDNDVDMAGASPTLTVGDGTGSPAVVVDKGAAGNAQLSLQSAGTDEARVRLDAADGLELAVDVGGTPKAMSMAKATGNINTPANLAASGQVSGAKQPVKSIVGTSVSVDWDDGNFAELDLELATGDVTVTLNNPVAGARYVMLVHQDSTNARNIIWPASVKWPGSGAPILSATGNAQDLFQFDYDGSVYHAVRVPRHTEYMLTSFVLTTGDSAVEKFIPFNSTVESTTVGYWNQILMPRDGMIVSATFRADQALNSSADVEVHRATNGSATFSEIDSDLTVNMATANTATVAELNTPFSRHDVIAVNFQTSVTTTTNVVCMLEVEFYD